MLGPSFPNLVIAFISSLMLGGVVTHEVEFNSSLLDKKDRDHFDGVYKDLVVKSKEHTGSLVAPSIRTDFSWLKFQLRQPNSTYTYLEFGKDMDHIVDSFHGTKSLDFAPKLSIEYQLLSSELSRYTNDLFCQNKHVKFFLSQDSKTITEFCQAELFTFTEPRDQGGWLPNDEDYIASRHCPVRHYERSLLELRDESNPWDIRINITGLLPHQQYSINLSMTLPKDYGGVARREEIECLHDSKPLFPPQADISSFSYNIEEDIRPKDDNEVVKLYWRSVPNMILSSKDFSYEISCKEEDDLDGKIYSSNKNMLYKSRVLVEKRINSTLDCRLRTKNYLGLSINSSRILVPKREDLLSLGPKFKFSGYAQGTQTFQLEWTPFKVNATTRQIEVLSNSSSFNNPGYIVIYWCSLSYTNQCEDISGMIRLNSSMSSHTLHLPPRSPISHRLFGIAYVLEEPIVSTGIVWARCGAISEQDFALRALQIMTRAVANNSHQAIAISWLFPACDLVVSGILSYEIAYCKGHSLNGCSSIWRNPICSNLQDSLYQFEHKSNSCATKTIFNHYSDEEILDQLQPATAYIIRMKYMLKNGTSGSWSEPLSFYTAAHPKIIASCWHSYLVGAIVLIIVSFIVGIVGYIRYSRAYRYWIFVCEKFDKTCKNVPKNVNMRMDYDPDEITVKYTINKGKCGDPDELTMSMLGLSEPDCDQQDYRRRVGAINGYSHCDDQTFDYVPREFVEGSSEEALATNDMISSEKVVISQEFEETSAGQDDISINSHSSFLNTILSEHMDLINKTVDQSKLNT